MSKKQFMKISDVMTDYTPNVQDMNWGEAFKDIMETQKEKFDFFYEVATIEKKFEKPIVLPENNAFDENDLKDGHIRLCAAYIAGLDSIEVSFVDVVRDFGEPEELIVTSLLFPRLLSDDEVDKLAERFKFLKLAGREVTSFIALEVVEETGLANVSFYWDIDPTEYNLSRIKETMLEIDNFVPELNIACDVKTSVQMVNTHRFENDF